MSYQEKLRAILSWPLVGRIVDQLNFDQVQTVVVWLQDLTGELQKTILCFCNFEQRYWQKTICFCKFEQRVCLKTYHWSEVRMIEQVTVVVHCEAVATNAKLKVVK